MLALVIAGLVAAAGSALGSSHREAPLITQTPKVDGTDFYLFRSYETGRAGYVTLLANYQPLQAPYGGPNYFLMDPEALYAIHIDNDGDAVADISYFFKFYNRLKKLTVPVNGVDVAVPLSNIGPFGATAAQEANRNVDESYVVVGVEEGRVGAARNLGSGDYLFKKPFDNIGTKSIANYASYADRHIARIGTRCAGEGRVFVGQRKDGFAVNLGEVFDLVNTNPLGPPDGERNLLDDANVTTIALELPIACLTHSGNPIIGAWTSAYTRDGLHYRQVSRLSAPLVNEVVIGLPDKDRFNASLPVNDASFAKYVTNPTLPILLQALFGVQAPTRYPRTDLIAAFLTGVPGLNKPASVRPAEMMRLNTSIAPKAAALQQTLGVLAGDTAGFPNGRRPGDDVVDIELRVAMGVLLPAADAPAGQLPYTDGAALKASDFRATFPYLNTPLPGSPSN
ncbi:DUF4331 domain-containing protein [Lysobacter terrestris]|uniref:DUF4331 domain-containing protein n=2 Tax=Agrilutibacter terrestris TaxID=2865112 RepID=A0A7H0G1M8_9GAMM|nr:DUF4331 domain-containing protein [Lysobacter terrestris]